MSFIQAASASHWLHVQRMNGRAQPFEVHGVSIPRENVLKATSNKGRGKVPWYTDGPTPELNSLAVIINWYRW